MISSYEVANTKICVLLKNWCTFSSGSLLIDFKGLNTRRIRRILTMLFTVVDAFLSWLKKEKNHIIHQEVGSFCPLLYLLTLTWCNFWKKICKSWIQIQNISKVSNLYWVTFHSKIMSVFYKLTLNYPSNKV